MSDVVAILVSAVKAAASTLRLLANSLEAAADQAAVAPVAVLSEVDLRDWELDEQQEPSSTSSSRPAPSQAPLVREPSALASGYDQVARSLPALPDHCVDICCRLAGTQEEVRARAQRAWEAGCWAKATIEGKVAKPRPSPKLAQKATCYIILRGPGISAPLRVDSAAEYFRLLPRFEEGSVSHSFPSQAEGRVYCLAAGVLFREPRGQ